MIHRIALITAAAFALGGTAAAATPRPQPVQLFILAGQSNMVGFGRPIPAETPSPRILKVLADGRMTPTVDPVFSYDATYAPGIQPGVGPGYWFARYLTARDPKIRVALVPCAASGTTIPLWQKGQPLYDTCVATVKAAVARGAHVAGILLQQGESDAGGGTAVTAAAAVAAWPSLFASFVSSMRADVGRSTPVVFAQLQTPPAGWPDWMVASYASLRAAQATIRLPRVAMIETSDLPYGVDEASLEHFAPPQVRIVGARFGAAWLQLRRSR